MIVSQLILYWKVEWGNYIIIFIILIHASVTFIFGDNLPCILNDNLVCVEAAITSNSITTISCFDNFNANLIFVATFSERIAFATINELGECTVGTTISSCATIGIVALVKHDFILAIFITTRIGFTDTLREETIKQA